MPTSSNRTTDQVQLMSLVDIDVVSEARKDQRADQQQAKLLEQWLEQVLVDHGDRVPNLQHAIDKQIAAVALLHGLTVVTRNTSDFVGCGVPLLNPFAND